MANETVEIVINDVDKSTLNFLYELAAEQDKTVDEVVNEMLREYLDSNN